MSLVAVSNDAICCHIKIVVCLFDAAAAVASFLPLTICPHTTAGTPWRYKTLSKAGACSNTCQTKPEEKERNKKEIERRTAKSSRWIDRWNKTHDELGYSICGEGCLLLLHFLPLYSVFR
jgi:hypothetical protein